MKRMKRIMALMLAAIMMMALSVTAFAAEGATGTNTLTVNVKSGAGVPIQTLKDQTIYLYKLFDVTTSNSTTTTNYAYTVNTAEGYKDALVSVLGTPITAVSTDEEFAKAVLDLGADNSEDVQKFANDFTKYALTNNLTATKTSEKLGDVVSHTFTGLDAGYYLVYVTGGKSIQSSLVTVNGETTVSLKTEAPSIEKTADKTTVNIGDVVTYTVKGVIPDTTGYDKYTYKIHDTLTEGLDFVKDAVGTAQEGTSYNVSVKIGEGQAETKAATLSGENNRIMTLDLSEWIRNNQNSKGQEFTVTYYAKVNADAVVQTNNSAHLEYGNDPDNITTTTPDVVTTPTYPVQIHKLIKDQQNSYLAGAIFRLYRSEEDANNNQNAIAVTGSNGTYTVDPEQVGDNKMYDMESIGDGTTVGTGMNLKLNGLAEGSYWLVETQAPDGYNKLTAPVKITITKSDTTNVNDWTIKQNDGVVDDKIIDIENTTGTLLPETGGMGTVIFTVIAVVMILGIAVSFVISRRKRA